MPPEHEPAPFVRLNLNCKATLNSAKISKGPPGTTVIGRCSQGCVSGDVFGSTIYGPDSSICTAAVHAGVIGLSGGDVVITVGHPQERYFSSEQHRIFSKDLNGTKAPKSFVMSIPTLDMLARVALKYSPNYAGSSTFGLPLMPKLG